jgi:MtN3 and saliva related transmembrane protein
MTIFDFLQLLGGIILAIGYFPQIKQILETESCKDINLKTYILLFLGIGLMEVYAVNQWMQGMAIMFCVTNTLSLILVGYIIALILAFRKETNIKDALYVTKHDDGSVIITPCKINMDTKEVFDIVPCMYDCEGGVDKEYILIGEDEFTVSVSENGVPLENEFWYEG